MDSLERRIGISNKPAPESLSHKEIAFLANYMPTNPEYARGYGTCETCNNCGSGDCNSCCAESDD